MGIRNRGPVTPTTPEREVLFVVDETVCSEHPGFSAVAVVLIEDPHDATARLDAVKHEILTDPYFADIPSVQSDLARRGLHYCEDHLEVRSRVIRALQGIAFEASVAFSETLPIDAGYAWYDRLLGAVLPDRLAENRHNLCRVLLEEHGDSRQRLAQLNSLIADSVVKIEGQSRRAFCTPPTVELGSKARSTLAIADYVVGAFRKFWIRGRHAPGSVEARQFNEVRNRVRVAVNVDTGMRYWRQHPLPG